MKQIAQRQMSISPDAIVRRIAGALLALLCLTVAATADETILRFESDVVLNLDGTVDVTEDITVRGEMNEIQRGIFRDIPTVLRNDDGSLLRSELYVHEVLRDGSAEPFFTEAIRNGRRIYIGDANRYLGPGVYHYTIRYTMTRMARRFDDKDELYWNATGNFWSFPIQNAVSTLTLPESARVIDVEGYTGSLGSTEQAVSIRRLSANRIEATATRVLGPQEGMSVYASFQKGVLPELTLEEQLGYYFEDHRNTIIAAGLAFIVLGYYIIAWLRVGRDPAKGTIIPRFHPPEGFSPALTHYVWAMGWKNSGWLAFTSAIVSLAAKGFITIEDLRGTKMGLATCRPEDEEEEPRLPPGESVVFSYINSHKSLVIDKSTGPSLSAACNDMIAALEAENRQVFFRHNVGYTAFGIFISVLSVLLIGFTGAMEVEWMFLTIFLSVIVVSLVTASHFILKNSRGLRFVHMAFFLFALFNVLSVGSTAFSAIQIPTVDSVALALITIVIANVLFSFIMRAPTVQGRKVMDEIEGFRMYLETAEKERLNFNDEPDLTTERFEAILPYAIALEVEKPWAEHFEAELARTATSTGNTAYMPAWYASDSFSTSDLGKSISNVSSSVSKAMVSAQPVSSSSSGSSGGGGGFSGGGGGGGGGGGW